MLRLKTGRTGSLGSLFIQPVERAHTKLEVRDAWCCHATTCIYVALSRTEQTAMWVESSGEGDKSPGMSFTTENIRGWANLQGRGISGIPHYILETIHDKPAVTIER